MLSLIPQEIFAAGRIKRFVNQEYQTALDHCALCMHNSLRAYQVCLQHSLYWSRLTGIIKDSFAEQLARDLYRSYGHWFVWNLFRLCT